MKSLKNQKVEKNHPIITTIAVIDLLLAAVMIFMTIMSIAALINFVKNPELAQETFTKYGVSFSSTIIFAVEIFVLLILLVVFANGMLRKKSWAITSRFYLAIVLSLYTMYNVFTGNPESLNVVAYYDFLVLIALGWLKLIVSPHECLNYKITP